jgi:hypothetical protein
MARQSRSTGATSHAHFDYNPSNGVVIATGQLEHIRAFIALAGGTMHLEHAGSMATAATPGTSSSNRSRRRHGRSSSSTAGGGGGNQAIARKPPATAKKSVAPATRTAGAAG